MTCGWSSWKRWHFSPAQDSIPDHSSCLPTDIRASLPKKEIIWDSFGSLNWLTTVSEKYQDPEVAGEDQGCPGSAALSPHTAGAWLALAPRPTWSSGGAVRGVRKGNVHHVLKHTVTTWSHSYHQHMGKNRDTNTFPNTLVLVFAPLQSTFIFKRTFLFHVQVLQRQTQSEGSPKASPDSCPSDRGLPCSTGPSSSEVQRVEKGRDQH